MSICHLQCSEALRGCDANSYGGHYTDPNLTEVCISKISLLKSFYCFPRYFYHIRYMQISHKEITTSGDRAKQHM